jgi:hypothetical protein
MAVLALVLFPQGSRQGKQAQTNRISYGCINVPAKFFDTVVSPAFTGTKGIVYVLPETRPRREIFGAYDVRERAGRNYASRNGASR